MLQRFRRLAPVLSILVAILSAQVPTSAADPDSVTGALKTITQKELKKHVGYLAGDALEGREAGSRGGKAAALYLRAELEKRKKLQPAGDNKSFEQSFGNGYRNVMAVLPGNDPKLKGEFVVVCAHFDHVGYGTEQNSLGQVGYIHNGADDNACGTAAVLEVLDALTQMKSPPRRSILFAFWDAEEKGLLGSTYWVKHPTRQLSKIALQINADMVGRMRDNLIEVHGTRSAIGLRRFVSEQNHEDKMQIHFKWTIKQESDHYPFIVAGIPSVMLHTGKHRDYHRPSDDIQKLNIAGMQQCARLMTRLALTAANADKSPEYRRESFLETDDHAREWFRPLSALPPRLGLSWDVKQAKQGRIEVVDVTDALPAATAGFQSGDRIVRFADNAVTGPDQFRQLVMSAVNPVSAVVKRVGVAKPITLTVRLAGSPRRVGISWATDQAEPGTVILRRIVSGSPADIAGLKLHDRVLAVDGRRFRNNAAFRERIAAPKAHRLRLTIERAGRIQTVTLRFPGAGDNNLPVPALKPRR